MKTFRKYSIPALLLTGILLLIPKVSGNKSSGHFDQDLASIEISLADHSLEELNENGKDYIYPTNNITIYQPAFGCLYMDSTAEIKGRGAVSKSDQRLSFCIKGFCG